tara:strand:- start:1029 stop:2306 length:1278 start_codon:yes stop_codon:yes gene_type:complete
MTEEELMASAYGVPSLRPLSKSTMFLYDKCSASDFKLFKGNAFEWITIETLIFSMLLLTMLFYMIKSRFSKVGIDNSNQFEPMRLSLVVKQIVHQIRKNIEAEPKDAKKRYVDNEKRILVENIQLKIKLSERAFDEIKSNKEIDPKDAPNWLRKCLVGKLTKAQLDEERMKETNSLDMMQNTSIIYHTESILEMQIITLIACYILNDSWAHNFGYNKDQIDPVSGYSKANTTKVWFFILLGEHIVSYLFSLYRSWELKTKGVTNSYGIETAPCESYMRYFEIFVDFIIFGAVIFYASQLSVDEFNEQPFLTYWISFDIIIMFFTLPYTKLCQIIMLNDEVTKNIFTIYQVQRKQLITRREKNPNNTDRKKFFEDDDGPIDVGDVGANVEGGLKKALHKKPKLIKVDDNPFDAPRRKKKIIPQEVN